MAMQKSLFHKDSRHLTTANAYVSGRRGRRPLQGWRVRFRCRVAISNSPINQNLKFKKTHVKEKAMLKLTNIDSPDDVSLFEATTIPAEIKGGAVTMTTRGEEIFDVVRYL